MHYVYYLLDPETQDLLYIGRSNRPKTRMNAFKRRTGRNVCFGLCQRFSDIERACQAEVTAITKHWPPYNQIAASSIGTLGQATTVGYRHAESVKETLRQLRSGKQHPAEVKVKISKSLLGNQYAKGFKHSEETRRKVAQAQLGKRRSPEQRANMKAAQLLQWKKKKEQQNEVSGTTDF